MRRLLALCLLVAAPVFGLADHGYEARANGMDWDDDFSYGEAVDDGKACDDADTDGAVIVIEDIDGDSNDEAQIYVIPATGTDDSNCGGPNAADACDSVQYAIDNRLDTGSYEDIICLVGTSHETLLIVDQDGDAGFKTRTASGDEVYDFQYPSNPNVIMGADRDQDGNYPPFDTDDTAVFDGEVGSSYLEFFLDTSAGDGTEGTDRWEFAHFTIQEYGTDDGVPPFTDAVNGITLNENGASRDTIVRLDGGSFVTDGWTAGTNHAIRILDSVANDDDYNIFSVSASTITVQVGSFSADDIANTSIRLLEMRDLGARRGPFMYGNTDASDPEDHLYYHDIYAYRIGYNQETLSFYQVMYDMWGRDFNYAAIENYACVECCGYIVRGQSQTGRYMRVQNTSLDFYCEDDPEGRVKPYGVGAIKHWGDTRYIEYMYNDWDLSPSAFAVDQDDSDSLGGGAYGFNTCIRDVYVINNIIRNPHGFCFSLEGGLAGQCTITPGDNLNFLRNQCIIDETVYPSNIFAAIQLKTGLNSDTIYHKNITFANNLFADLTGVGLLSTVFKVQDGVPATGPDVSGYTVAFVNNTAYSTNYGEGSITEAPAFHFDDDATDRSHSYVIKNNVIAGGSADDWYIRFVSSGVGVDDLDMDYNIFEDDGGDREFWAPDGTRYQTMALYSAATGLDTNSKGEGQNACDVTFLNRGSDMHLNTADTCAQDASTSTGDGANAFTTIDFDKDARPQNALWDIGYDEYESGYVPVGACCDAACEVTTDAACDLWEGAGTTCTPDPCETEPPATPVSGFAEGVSFKGVSKD